MGKKIGLFVSLDPSDHDCYERMHVSHGFISSSFTGRRLFSLGSVTIGTRHINPARIVWDSGSKVTIVFVPDPEDVESQVLGHFDISGIGASETAASHVCSIDLGGGIVIDGICAGILPDDGSGSDDDTIESADVILGMDAIECGSLRINGPSRMWSFKT